MNQPLSRARRTLLGAVGLAGILLLWVVLPMAGAPSRLLPSLPTMVDAARGVIGDGALAGDLGATVARWLGGFLGGALGGIVLGLVLSASRTLRALTGPVIDFFRSLPATASFPLFLLAFGIGDASKVAMSAFVTFLPVMVATIAGVTEISRIRARSLACFGAGPRFLVTRVYPWQAAALISSALRTTISFSLMVTIVAEMFIGSGSGIGQRLFESFQLDRAGQLYFYLLVSGSLGLAGNTVFTLIDRKVRVQWA